MANFKKAHPADARAPKRNPGPQSARAKRRYRGTTGNRRISPEHTRAMKWHSVSTVFKRVSIIVLVLAGLGAIGYGLHIGYRAMARSKRFTLQTIHLSGNRKVSRKELLAFAGIEMKMPLMAIDPPVVAKRIAKHPWVKECNVQRTLPSSLSIEVTERVARAVLAVDALYLVDDDGELFKRALPAHARQYPIISGLDRVFYTTQKEHAHHMVAKAIEFAEEFSSLRPMGKEVNLAEIHIDRYTGYEVEVTPGPWRLHLGWNGLLARCRRGKWIIDELKRRGKHPRIVYLDNERKPQRVVVRLDR